MSKRVVRNKLIGFLLLLFACQCKVHPITLADVPWKRMAFVTPEVGHCWGDRGLLRTEDRGRTWTFLNESILLTLPYFGGPDWLDERKDGSPCFKPISAVSFVTPEVGWVASLSHLLSTTDGGKTWKDLTPAKAPLRSGEVDYFIADLQFTNRTDGWMTGDDALFRTHDGGQSWELVREASVSKFRLWGQGQGLLMNQADGLELTLDGGKNWLEVGLPQLSERPDGDWCLLDASRWFLSTDKALIQTSDAGQTWALVEPTLHADDRLIGIRVSLSIEGQGWITREIARKTGDGSIAYVSQLFEIHGGQYSLLSERENCSLVPIAMDYGEGLMIVTGPVSGPSPMKSSLMRTRDGGHTWETVFENRCTVPNLPPNPSLQRSGPGGASVGTIR